MNLRCIFTVREQNQPTTNVLYLDVRPHRRELRYNNTYLRLPERQFRFMQALMANHPKPMTHWEMFYHVWGEGMVNLWGEYTHVNEDGGPLVPASCVQQLAAKLRVKLAPLGLMVHAPRKGYGYEIAEVSEEETGSPPREGGKGSKEDGAETPGAYRGQARVPVRPDRKLPNNPARVTLCVADLGT